MAIIYMKHPVHGAKVATAPEEAAQDRRNGWLEFDPSAVAPAQAPSTDETETPILNALPLRRGRVRLKAQGE